MKTRLLIALAGVAISFALPIFAQPKAVLAWLWCAPHTELTCSQRSASDGSILRGCLLT
jgi:hypothetical protein